MTGEGSIEDVIAGRARWAVVCGDCLDVLPTLADKCVDAVVTDPPYGIGLVTKTTARSAPSGVTAVYSDEPMAVGEMVSRFIPEALRVAARALIFPGPAMLWAYPEPSCVGCVFAPAYSGRCSWGFQCMHPILFYGNDPYLASGRGARPNSLLQTGHPPGNELDHPCPKPVDWMLWAVQRATARDGETVLDPFGGTGTTGVAALRLGRRVILIEREPKWADLCRDRLRAEESGSTLQAARAGQVPLFGGER